MCLIVSFANILGILVKGVDIVKELFVCVEIG